MSEVFNKIYSFDSLFFDGTLEASVGKIYQISELSVVRGGEIPEHTQRCDEITYVISGSAVFYSGDNLYKLSEGQIHLIKGGLRHRIISDEKNNFRYICIGYVPNLENPDIRCFVSETESINDVVLNDDGTVRSLCKLLVDEMYARDGQSNNMIDFYLKQILITIYRLMRGRVKKTVDSKTKTGHTIYNMLRYIDREYINIKNIKEIADYLSYSEYYISHLFKEKMGVSIKSYINEKKIKYAASLLITTSLSIEEISEYIGFETAHSFRQAFKKHYGLSPSDYKKNSNF